MNTRKFRKRRGGLRVHRAGGKRRRIIRKVELICGLVIVISLIFAALNPRLRSIVRVYAQAALERECQRAVADAADSAIEQASLTYDDIIKIERGDDNTVTAVMADIAQVNKIKTVASLLMLDAVAQIGGNPVCISLGTITGNALFVGRGPDIRVRAELTGSAEVEIVSSFESVGINQTRHIIAMDITCRVYMVMLGAESAQEILLSVPIAETIIVGSVPSALLPLDNNVVND